MKRIRLIGLTVAAVCALGALFATSAFATLPEFRAESYPVVEKSKNTNIHGFSIAAGAVVSLCKSATFNTGEEGAVNPTKESETITVHPIYSECFITIPAGNSEATVSTTGCNYTLRAKSPGTSGGEVKVVCSGTNKITVTDNTLPACKTKVGTQTLKGVSYVDEPGLPAFGEVSVGSEVEKIKWETEGCGVASSGEDGQYREGELVLGVAKLAEKGKPANVKTKGETEAKAEDKVVVSGAEPGQTGTAHYYKNGISLAALLPEKEKVPVLSWGTLTLKSEPPSTAATTSCENAAGGFAENPGGINGPAGKGQTSDFASWNCSQAECPTGAEVEFPPTSGKFVKLEFIVFPGGTPINPKVAKGSLPWPNVLTEPEAKKIRAESKQVAVVLACVAQKSVEGAAPFGDGDGDTPQFLGEPTFCQTAGSFKQEPLIENGTQIGGPATSKITFDETSGKLSCEGPNSEKPPKTIKFGGKTSGKLHVMTYEGQELLLTH
jgi:hypothetical protein